MDYATDDSTKKPAATDNNVKKPSATDDNAKKSAAKKKPINWSDPGPDCVRFENDIRDWLNTEEDYYDSDNEAANFKVFATMRGISPNNFWKCQNPDP